MLGKQYRCLTVDAPAGMLAVIVELICTLHTSCSDWEESDMLMRMQLFSYVSSLCAQNQKNCK